MIKLPQTKSLLRKWRDSRAAEKAELETAKAKLWAALEENRRIMEVGKVTRFIPDGKDGFLEIPVPSPYDNVIEKLEKLEALMKSMGIDTERNGHGVNK